MEAKDEYKLGLHRAWLGALKAIIVGGAVVAFTAILSHGIRERELKLRELEIKQQHELKALELEQNHLGRFADHILRGDERNRKWLAQMMSEVSRTKVTRALWGTYLEVVQKEIDESEAAKEDAALAKAAALTTQAELTAAKAKVETLNKRLKKLKTAETQNKKDEAKAIAKDVERETENVKKKEKKLQEKITDLEQKLAKARLKEKEAFGKPRILNIFLPKPPSFAGKDLGTANLRGADLSGLDFRHADFKNADLSGATLTGAQIDEADLSNVKGLICTVLTKASGWQVAFRKQELRCNANIPRKRPSAGGNPLTTLEIQYLNSRSRGHSPIRFWTNK